jgi:tripartite-type tricarboxylate transporter receptor subunit TctC
MKLLRRTFLQLAASGAAVSAVFRIANANIYPTRPVRLMVGFGPGQAIDIVARLTAQWLSERLGQQFVIENRPGGGGNIAAEVVARAPADGYTLLVIGANYAINATLYDRLNYNLIRDIMPVASIYRVIQVMVVNPSFPAKSVPEFISYAKDTPGKINFASAGSGSVAHVTGELFKMMVGIDMQHVPYRGAPAALTDLIAGHVQVMFDNLPSSIEHVRASRLRALAVTATSRWPGLPDIPTVSDFVPGFETSAWAGIGAPKSTPTEIVGVLNREVNAGLTDPKIMSRIGDMGGGVLGGSPSDFGKLIANETEKWAKVVKFSGAQPE